jgi:hypothetical protein
MTPSLSRSFSPQNHFSPQKPPSLHLSISASPPSTPPSTTYRAATSTSNSISGQNSPDLRPKVTGSPSILHLRFDSDGSPSPERLSSKLHLRPKVTGSPAVLRTLSQGASTLYWINMLYRPIHF